MSGAAMPAELEAQLRSLTPTCTAMIGQHYPPPPDGQPVERPCTDPATHALHATCDGPHPPWPVQLMCDIHAHALHAMQARGDGNWICPCGRPLIVRGVKL